MPLLLDFTGEGPTLFLSSELFGVTISSVKLLSFFKATKFDSRTTKAGHSSDFGVVPS